MAISDFHRPKFVVVHIYVHCTAHLKTNTLTNLGNLHDKKELRRGRRHQLLKSSQIHLLLQQGDDIGVKGLPVRVVQVVLLRRLVEVALDDGEVLRVVNGLHDEPGESLLVLGIDGRGFDELGVQFGDGLLVWFRAEVCFPFN